MTLSDDSTIVSDGETQDKRVRIPWFPLYSHAREFGRSVDGRSSSSYAALRQQLDDQQGNPQQNTDWANPSEWIPERLSGDARALAEAVWETSEQHLNPRHTAGTWFLLRTYGLLVDASGTLRLTDEGRRFCFDADLDVQRRLDEGEGLLQILAIFASRGAGRRSKFLDDWRMFLLSTSNYQATSLIGDTWRRRVLNLVERGLVERKSGNVYEIAAAASRT